MPGVSGEAWLMSAYISVGQTVHIYFVSLLSITNMLKHMPQFKFFNAGQIFSSKKKILRIYSGVFFNLLNFTFRNCVFPKMF